MHRHLVSRVVSMRPAERSIVALLPMFSGIELTRQYATHNSLGRNTSSSSERARKQITVISDDGRLQWSELSGSEKFSRVTQQSFNLLLVLIGAVMTVRRLHEVSETILLTTARAVLLHSYISMFSPQIARRGSLIGLSTESRMIHVVSSYSVIETKSRHTAKQHGINGLGIDQSRMT
jgi:hypothetical protein